MDKISNWEPQHRYTTTMPRLLSVSIYAADTNTVICRKYGVPWTWTLILQSDIGGGMLRLVMGGIHRTHRLRFYTYLFDL